MYMVIADTILWCLNLSVSGLEVWLSGRALVYQVCGIGFDPQRALLQRQQNWIDRKYPCTLPVNLIFL